MTVKEIVKVWLKENGFTGLYGLYGCSCEIDDLMPCDELNMFCKAGYKISYGPDECPCGEGCPFHIHPEVQND